MQAENTIVKYVIKNVLESRKIQANFSYTCCTLLISNRI